MGANNVIGLGAPDHKFLAGEFVLTELLLGKLVDDSIPGQVRFHTALDLQDLYTTFSITQSIHNPFMRLDIALGESKQAFEHFGSKGMRDFTLINDKSSKWYLPKVLDRNVVKDSYLRRHEKNEDWISK